MGRCAVDVARSVNYTGAGTVEFIMDEGLNFYFLEMNTRLQVEHPVTELITGIDLVKEQIKIARGGAISFKQEDLKIHGHAVELRVYAEDPANNFLPDIGTLQTYITPKGPGVRVDDGFEQGMEIPIYYDPMIAKLITFADTRAEAIERMIRAIDEYQITGITTTLGFGRFVMQHEAFTSGNFDTHFVKKYFSPEVLRESREDEAIVAAIVMEQLLSKKRVSIAAPVEVANSSNWIKNRKQI
jgi:acetyl/propionyl-CoA carboxylase alpha subunit